MKRESENAFGRILGMFPRRVLGRETGRTLMETLGVLAIMGLLTIGSIVGYRQAITTHRVNETLSLFSKTVAGTLTGFILEQYGETDSDGDFSLKCVPILEVISGVDLNRERFLAEAPSVEGLKTETEKRCFLEQSFRTIGDNNIFVTVDSPREFSVHISNMSLEVCEGLLRTNFGQAFVYIGGDYTRPRYLDEFADNPALTREVCRELVQAGGAHVSSRSLFFGSAYASSLEIKFPSLRFVFAEGACSSGEYGGCREELRADDGNCCCAPNKLEDGVCVEPDCVCPSGETNVATDPTMCECCPNAYVKEDGAGKKTCVVDVNCVENGGVIVGNALQGAGEKLSRVELQKVGNKTCCDPESGDVVRSYCVNPMGYRQPLSFYGVGSVCMQDGLYLCCGSSEFTVCDCPCSTTGKCSTAQDKAMCEAKGGEWKNCSCEVPDGTCASGESGTICVNCPFRAEPKSDYICCGKAYIDQGGKDYCCPSDRPKLLFREDNVTPVCCGADEYLGQNAAGQTACCPVGMSLEDCFGEHSDVTTAASEETASSTKGSGPIVCPAGQVPAGEVCICPSPKTQWDEANQKCVCPAVECAGTVNAETCQCESSCECPEGEGKLDVLTGVCTCPTPPQCENELTSCLSGRFGDGEKVEANCCYDAVPLWKNNEKTEDEVCPTYCDECLADEGAHFVASLNRCVICDDPKRAFNADTGTCACLSSDREACAAQNGTFDESDCSCFTCSSDADCEGNAHGACCAEGMCVPCESCAVKPEQCTENGRVCCPVAYSSTSGSYACQINANKTDLKPDNCSSYEAVDRGDCLIYGYDDLGSCLQNSFGDDGYRANVSYAGREFSADGCCVSCALEASSCAESWDSIENDVEWNRLTYYDYYGIPGASYYGIPGASSSNKAKYCCPRSEQVMLVEERYYSRCGGGYDGWLTFDRGQICKDACLCNGGLLKDGRCYIARFASSAEECAKTPVIATEPETTDGGGGGPNPVTITTQPETTTTTIQGDECTARGGTWYDKVVKIKGGLVVTTPDCCYGNLFDKMYNNGKTYKTCCNSMSGEGNEENG